MAPRTVGKAAKVKTAECGSAGGEETSSRTPVGRGCRLTWVSVLVDRRPGCAGIGGRDLTGGTIDPMTLATGGPEPQSPRRVPTPWGETAGRADTAIALLLGLYVAYSLALWALVPALIGSHPLLLEIVSGSTLAEVSVGAHSRLGELPLWFAVVAGVPGSMMFDWIFWWAGRRWGDRALHLLLGRDSSPRGVARRDARAARLEQMAARFGPAAVVLAYFLPLPAVLIYVTAGLSGMRLRTFLALDVVGTLLWVGPLVGLGYAIGKPAVDVVHRIDHYSTLLTVVVVLVVIGVQARRRHIAFT
jgi:membrane-associated protein